VISVESELSQRESDLESLQSQQRALQGQTSLASITLTLQTAAPAAVKPAPKHHHAQSGFVGGLTRGWHGFVAAAKAVATAVGTLLPFLVLLALLAAAGRFVWRRRPHPAPAPAPAPSE
jgi:predicted lipid-binding transport protein (Tim44 family)